MYVGYLVRCLCLPYRPLLARLCDRWRVAVSITAVHFVWVRV